MMKLRRWRHVTRGCVTIDHGKSTTGYHKNKCVACGGVYGVAIGVTIGVANGVMNNITSSATKSTTGSDKGSEWRSICFYSREATRCNGNNVQRTWDDWCGTVTWEV